MPIMELLKLSRDSAKRARDAMAAEKARGGPDWGARAQAAAARPIAEIAEHSRAVQRFRKIDGRLDDRQRSLRLLRQDTDRPPEIRRRRTAELQTEIANLKTERRDLEDEVRTTLLPALPRMKPEPPVEARTPPLPQMKPEVPVEERTPPLPRMKPEPQQPENYLGSLALEHDSTANERERQTPIFLVPGQGKLQNGDTNAVERIAGAAALVVSDLFESPYGIAHEDLGPLINRSSEDAYTPVLGLVRTFNEILIEGGTQLGDLALRTAVAPFVGGIAAVGQTAIEMGMTPTEARRLVRDLYIFGEVSAIAAGTSPTTLAGRGRPYRAHTIRDPDTLMREAESSGVLDRHIEQLGPEQREATKRRLQQSYDEGQRAARKEIELRDLGGVEQAVNPPSIIRQKVRDLVDFVQRNRSERITRGEPERVWFGRVSDSRARELSERLKQDYGIDYDLRGAVHRIDEDGVGHILGGHATDQLPFTASDFELMPEIVGTGRLIPNTKLSGKNEIPAVVYRKLIGDWYYVVEEVQKKGKVLSVQSAYKTPAPKRKQ